MPDDSKLETMRRTLISSTQTVQDLDQVRLRVLSTSQFVVKTYILCWM